MPYQQPMSPDSKTTDAAVQLGRYVREERGNCGVRMYLGALSELLPRAWVGEVASRLDAPLPPEPVTPPDPNRPIPPLPPEPRQKKPDMEKLFQLMQLMGNLKS